MYEISMMMLDKFELLNLVEPIRFIEQNIQRITNISGLSRSITRLVRDTLADKSLVLLIDEVDKSANNRVFLNFSAMLRNKYLTSFIGPEK